MSGRALQDAGRLFLAAGPRYGPALREELAHRRRVEEIIDFLEIAHIRRTPVGKLPYGLQKRVELPGRWRWSPNSCCWTSRWRA